MKITGQRTPYGFEWGPVEVSRCCDDERQGWVILHIETEKTKRANCPLEIYVTRTGKIRIFSNGEWAPPKKGTK